MPRLLCLTAILLGLHVPCSTHAEAPRSIKSVPSDAAFFFGLHNQADLIRRIAGSDSVKRIVGMTGDTGLMEAIEIAYAPDEDSIAGSEQTWSLVRQILASDAFVWGDANWAETFRAMHELSRRTEILKQEEGEEYDAAKLFMSIPEEELAKIRLPSTVIAFELEDIEPAQQLLDLAHAWLDANPPPQWALYRGRKPVNDDHMLVFTLRPWEYEGISFDWNETKADPQAVKEKFQRLMEEREWVMAIGVVQSRLTACFAEDLSAVRRLVATERDTNQDAIADQADFKTLLAEKNGPLIVSAHVSDDFAAARNELQAPGFLTNLSSFLSTLPTLLSAPGMIDDAQMAMIAQVTQQTTDDLKSVSQRWDALAIKPTGWSTAAWAGPDGISGRSTIRSIDEKLPEQPLDVYQFVGKDVLFVYGWQSTTLAERVMLSIEAAQKMIDMYMAGGMMIIHASDVEIKDLQQARDDLKNSADEVYRLLREHWLPSLHQGGHAIVISAVDPIPETDDETPVAVSLLTRVASAEGLREAGTLLHDWGNQLVTRYLTLAGEAPQGLLMPMPTATQEKDSTVFQLPLHIFEEVEAADNSHVDNIVDAEANSDANPIPDQIVQKDKSPGKPSEWHWRLSDQLLVMGSDLGVSRRMLTRRNEPWSDHKGILRSIVHLDIAEISRFYRSATKMVPEEDRATMLQAADVLSTIGGFRSETRTIDGQTRTHWEFEMPLGE